MSLKIHTGPGHGGQTGVRLIFTSSTSDAFKSASVSDIDTVVITEALIGVEKIKFKPMGQEDEDD